VEYCERSKQKVDLAAAVAFDAQEPPTGRRAWLARVDGRNLFNLGNQLWLVHRLSESSFLPTSRAKRYRDVTEMTPEEHKRRCNVPGVQAADRFSNCHPFLVAISSLSRCRWSVVVSVPAGFPEQHNTAAGVLAASAAV
jgi:hypothetical protein